MYFKARMSNHPGKWGNYLALGRDEVCVLMCVWSRCVCISVKTNRKKQAVLFSVCVSALKCYLACLSDTVCKRRVKMSVRVFIFIQLVMLMSVDESNKAMFLAHKLICYCPQ